MCQTVTTELILLLGSKSVCPFKNQIVQHIRFVFMFLSQLISYCSSALLLLS